MHAWESIQRVVDYIEDNIAQEITPKELADVATLSLFYFQRLFSRLVKRPVSEYVKLRRLARATEMLKNRDQRILDIALAYGFNSHERFTRVFKAAFGMTPEEYRVNPVHLNQIVKPELQLNYTIVDENVPLITESMVLEITRKKLTIPEKYIGFTGKVALSQTPVGETTGIDIPGQLWEAFHLKKADIPGLVVGGDELGVSMFSEVMDGTFTYFAGALADLTASIPEDCSVYELPVAEYVVCVFEAECFAELSTAALDKAMKYLFETWLKKHRLMTLPFSAEKYSKTTPDATAMEIWVRPVPIENTEQAVLAWCEQYDIDHQPTLEEIDNFTGNHLWGLFNSWLQQTYGSKPKLSYSGCSMQKGWNVKYQKRNKSLCTLYPMNNYFIALVVIGVKEIAEAERLILLCSEYTQNLYQHTDYGVGGKWLMVQVTDTVILNDVKMLIGLRVMSR